jgi:hypothetical protein
MTRRCTEKPALVSAVAKAPDWLSGSTNSSRAPLMSRKRALWRSAVLASAVA